MKRMECPTPPWIAVLACVLGFLLDVAAYWPGHLSFDSAYAWWQAQGGTSSNIIPPIFVLALRVCAAIGAGPGPVFAFHALLFWAGLGLILTALQVRAGKAVLIAVLLGLAPVPWLLRAHLWTDVGLFCALVFATGALVRAQVRCRAGWLFAALPAIAYAALLRHNALAAILPFAVWWVVLLGRCVGWPVRRHVQAGGVLVFLVALMLLAHALERRVEWRVAMWPSLAQFDLAGMSVRTDRMLLPDFMIGQGLDVDELRTAFRPWSNLPMLTNTRHGMRAPFLGSDMHDEHEVLRAAWLSAIVNHPDAWLAHRLEFTRSLFGTHPREWPPTLIYADVPVGYRDDPPIPHNSSALHDALMKAVSHLRDTAVLAAWPYLLAGLLALPVAWRRRGSTSGQTGLILLASAWLYAVPLMALAPSAELRYLGWPCVASLLAVACVLVPRRE